MVRTMFFKRAALVVLMLSVGMLVSSVYAASSDNEVTLVVNGEGVTKDEATKVALRNAIEQAFGTFVSSNTAILNDELVKDEIVTVSSGNIKKYEYIDDTEIDGTHFVTVKAIVSVGKLVSYVQQKGGQTELAGATFAMDVKMKRLYKENEEKALEHLMVQLEELMPQMFDYSITVGSPKAVEGPRGTGIVKGAFGCEAVITISTNRNYDAVRELIWNTLGSLCLKTYSEVKDYREKGIEPYQIDFSTKNIPVTYITPDHYAGMGDNSKVYFRSGKFFQNFSKLMERSLRFSIDDGIKVDNYVYGGDGEFGKFVSDNGVFYARGISKPVRSKYPEGVTPPNMGYQTFGMFPISKSARWTIKGSIKYKEAELEKVRTIKVLPPKVERRKQTGNVDSIVQSLVLSFEDAMKGKTLAEKKEAKVYFLQSLRERKIDGSVIKAIDSLLKY